MRLRALVFLALSLVISCGCTGRSTVPDPAPVVAATSLSDGLAVAAITYGVPARLLAAVAYTETRFGEPRAGDSSSDGLHRVPDVGPLHLRPSLAGVDTLSRAETLLGVTRDALARSPMLALAGGAAVLADLGRATGARQNDLGSWADAIGNFSGHPEPALRRSYALEVFSVLHDGVSAESFTGETITIAPTPDIDVVSRLGVSQSAMASGDYGPALWVPASGANYTNGRSGARVEYIVIHTMEGSYAGSVSWFRNPSAGASAHYMVRSSDGQITQMVDESDTAWHAGNWNINIHSIGIEHEGFTAAPGRWYTEEMYRSSARLVRMLCDRYGIPIDRAHIIGHYQVPRSGSGAPCGTGATGCGGAGGHTDPGNGGSGWNWSHFIDLVRGGGEPSTPPCVRRAGFLGFNCSGPIAGLSCVSVNEPADPNSWSDNFLCTDGAYGLRWSNAGPIAGMRCTSVNEASEPASHTWGDNYVCAPEDFDYLLSWSSAGPIAGRTCVAWNEPADPHTWTDNYLCAERRPCLVRNGLFGFNCAGAISGMTCVSVNEPADPDAWTDNYVCTERSVGLRWSSAGPISGMRCTSVNEASEPASHTWGDNYLCVPEGSEVVLSWSTAGRIAGRDCIRWSEPSDPHTWNDNYLCWTIRTVQPDAGVRDAGAQDVGVEVDADVRDAGVRDVSVDTGNPFRDINVVSDGVSDADADGVSDADAGGVSDDTGSDGDAGDDGLTVLPEESGCACRVSASGRVRGVSGVGRAAWALGVVAVVLKRRRRSRG